MEETEHRLRLRDGHVVVGDLVSPLQVPTAKKNERTAASRERLATDQIRGKGVALVEPLHEVARSLDGVPVDPNRFHRYGRLRASSLPC